MLNLLIYTRQRLYISQLPGLSDSTEYMPGTGFEVVYSFLLKIELDVYSSEATSSLS